MPFVDSQRERKCVIKFPWWLDGAECDDGATRGMKGKKLKCFLIFNYRIVVWCSACIVISFPALILSYCGGGELIWDMEGDAEWKTRNYERILRAGVDEGVQRYVEFQKCWENVTKDFRISLSSEIPAFYTSRIPCRSKYSKPYFNLRNFLRKMCVDVPLSNNHCSYHPSARLKIERD